MSWNLTRRSMMISGLAAFAGSALPLRVLAAAQEQRLVTVELFTSQGCSSCPAADALLGQLTHRADVLALSWPVDYWDYLGWRDTLAKAAFTQRQRDYAKKIAPHQPYTPQMVIDGEVDVVGSDPGKVEAALAMRLKKSADRVPVSAAWSSDSLTLDVGAGPAQDATLWLVRYRPHVEVNIGGGENQGRDASYYNVVESASPLGMWSGEASHVKLARADLAMDADHSFAVLLQAAECGPVLGAAKIG